MKMAPSDRPYDFLLVGHCKYSSILYHFKDKTTDWLKIAFAAPAGEYPAEYCHRLRLVWKTRMVWLADGKKSAVILLDPLAAAISR